MGVRSFIVCLLFLFCASAYGKKYFKFEDLSKKDSIIHVEKFEMSPDPISMSKNITVNMTATLKEHMTEHTIVKMKYYVITGVFGFKLPVPCFIWIGSCSHPVCYYMEQFPNQIQTFYQEDMEYECPARAGKYGGHNLKIQIPPIPAIAKMVMAGKYEIEMTFLNKAGGKEIELGRYKLAVQVGK